MSLETTYTITGKRTGTITFKFDLLGNLVFFRYEGEPLSPKQQKWLYPRLAVHERQMKDWQAISEFTVVKGLPDVSFDNFWNMYDNKAKKEVSRTLFEKLSDDDKFNAIIFIKRYNSWLKWKGTAKALPDTYLRQKRWLDEL